MKTINKIANNTPVHYYVTGDNNDSCIVFLHSAFSNHRLFDKQVQYFAPNHKVITVDLLGHGKSQNIKTKDTIADSSSHINTILQMENIKNCHIVGVSIGSLVAQDFANKFPDKVLSLFSLGGYDINNYDAGLQKASQKQQAGFLLKAVISIKWFSKSNANVSVITKEAKQEFYNMNCDFRRSSFRYMAGLTTIMNRYNITERKYPLLIAYGEKDNPLAIKASETWHLSEPASILKCIPDAGHCANMDNPASFNETLNSFINNAN